MKHHNLFFTIGIICIILIGSFISYNNEINSTNTFEQQAADKALPDSLLTHQATVDSIYNSLPYDVLQELYFQIGNKAPKEYVVDEYLEHQDYYNNLN